MANKIGQVLGCTIEKQHINYRIDFKILNGDAFLGILEYKRRYFSYGKYPDVMLSEHKYLAGKAISEKDNVPFLFVVELNDGTYYTELDGDYKVTYSGRTVQTRDKWDIENVIHVPMVDFAKLNV